MGTPETLSNFVPTTGKPVNRAGLGRDRFPWHRNTHLDPHQLDVDLKFTSSALTYYDGQGLHGLPKELGAFFRQNLGMARLSVFQTGTRRLKPRGLLPQQNNISYEPVPVRKRRRPAAANTGRCLLFPLQPTVRSCANTPRRFENPREHIIPPEIISKKSLVGHWCVHG